MRPAPARLASRSPSRRLKNTPANPPFQPTLVLSASSPGAGQHHDPVGQAVVDHLPPPLRLVDQDGRRHRHRLLRFEDVQARGRAQGQAPAFERKVHICRRLPRSGNHTAREYTHTYTHTTRSVTVLPFVSAISLLPHFHCPAQRIFLLLCAPSVQPAAARVFCL